MSRNLFRIALLLLGCVATFNQAVYARSCEEKSENFAKLGDDYFKLGEQDMISAKNKQIIAVFYEKIQGEWTGHRVLTECVDADPNNDNALSQAYKNARTNLSITVDSSGGVNMQSSLYYDGNMNVINDVLFSGEVTDVKVIGDASLVYAEKYRQKLRPKKHFSGSRLAS